MHEIKLWSVELVSLLMFVKSQLQIIHNGGMGWSTKSSSIQTVECMIKLWSVELVSLLMFMKSQLQIYDNNENGMESTKQVI